MRNGSAQWRDGYDTAKNLHLPDRIRDASKTRSAGGDISVAGTISIGTYPERVKRAIGDLEFETDRTIRQR